MAGRIGQPIDDLGFAVGEDESDSPDRRIGRHGAEHQGCQPVPVRDVDPAALDHAGDERCLVPGRLEMGIHLLRDQGDAEFRALAQQIDGIAGRADDGEAEDEQQRHGDQRTEAETQDRRH